jgi:bifunctional non-homologous end joining protein LigD
MLAVAGSLPDPDDAWSFEFKWDGVRAMSYVEDGRIRILSRNDSDVTARYPELRGMTTALGARPAVLDGEIVAVDDAGRPSFEALQSRMQISDESRARRLAAEVPVVLFVFDVVHLDGRSVTPVPYRRRRVLLESLELAGPHWATPPAYGAPGSDVLAAATRAGLEGVVAKRSDSVYRPGRRDAAWVKVKTTRTQEVVIGGWVPGKGSRAAFVGALVLGIPEPGGAGRLRYVGRVGTGFTEAALADLRARFESLRRDESPFARPLAPAERRGVTWVDPRLVGEVRFAQWTAAGRLRHPTWRGLRLDKRPGEVVVEP